MMVISLDNFNILASQQAHNPYYLFFRKHYLNIEE